MAKNLVDGTNIIIEENADNINLDLSSTYTSELEQTINDSLKNNNIYSTTEQVIGTWLNKPLYRKIVDLGSLPNASSKTVSTGLDVDVAQMKQLIGYAKHTQNYGFVTLPRSDVTIQIAQSNGVIYINTTDDYSSWKGFAIIEYTKSTD